MTLRGQTSSPTGWAAALAAFALAGLLTPLAPALGRADDKTEVEILLQGKIDDAAGKDLDAKTRDQIKALVEKHKAEIKAAVEKARAEANAARAQAERALYQARVAQ